MYPARVLGMLFLVLLCVGHAVAFGELSVALIAFAAFLMIYPHVWFFHVRRSGEGAGLGVTLIDAFCAGVTVYCISYSLLPTFVLCTVVLANGLGLNGPRHAALSVAVMAAGAVVLAPIGGFDIAGHESVASNVISALYLLLYFTLYANIAYTRSLALKSSRIELKEQRIVAEIAKQRSDKLLENILPRQVAADFARDRRVEPQLIPEASLLFVKLDPFSANTAPPEPDQLLDVINHCFKAFDAIVARHELLKVRTIGSGYLAVGGAAADDHGHPQRAAQAALEISAFMGQLEVARQARESWRLRTGIALHSGPVVAGLVESDRFAYDLLGTAVDLTMDAARLAPENAVCVTAEMKGLLGSVDAGMKPLELVELDGRSVFIVERQGAASSPAAVVAGDDQKGRERSAP